MAIVGNALAGIVALVAWRRPSLRGRWVFAATIAAEVALLVQVATGAALVSSKRYTVPRFHMFYGIIGLFLMGVGIRAVLQVQ